MNYKYSPENKNRKTWTLWIFITLLGALLLNSLAGDYFKKIFINLMTALTPVLVGFILAFVLKKIVDFLENKVFYKLFIKLKNSKKVNRIFCICLLFLLLAVLVYIFIAFLVPEIAKFVEYLSANISEIVENIRTEIVKFLESTHWFTAEEIEKFITNFFDSIGKIVTDNIPLIAENIAQFIQHIATLLVYLLLGILIAFLMLYKKESIGNFSQRLTYATFNKKKADKIVETAKLSDKVFYNYITIKCIEAVIVFCIVLPGLLIFKVPYAVVMAIFLAIINIIPYIGSIIGAIPILAFTTATSSLVNALWVMIYLIVVLNVYGTFVAPFIYGKKMKISALLILISVLVFGALFGFWGVLIGPPIMAVIWTLVNEFIESKEEEKRKLEKYNLLQEDINDMEILQEAAMIVKQRRLEQENSIEKMKINNIVSENDKVVNIEETDKIANQNEILDDNELNAINKKLAAESLSNKTYLKSKLTSKKTKSKKIKKDK